MLLPKQLTHQFDDLVHFAEEINRRNAGSATAVVVIQQGKIVTEHYSGYHSQLPGARAVQADSQFNVASTRKSYIGLAVACAVHSGKINNIDDPVTDYLPELDRDVMAGTTIRHLLTHTHGLNTDGQGNLYREFIAGNNWAYRGENILMLAEIVHRVTGQTVAHLLQEQVFTPLDFQETGWRTEPDENLVPVIYDPNDPPEWKFSTPDGNQHNLFVSARELAYFGYLHLKKGEIDGKQIVPARVIELATSVQSPKLPDPDLPENGFLWYVKETQAKRSEIGERVPAGSYQILGISGPLVLVIPDHDLVVVRMYNKQYNYSSPDRDYLSYLREFGDRVMDCLEK